ncbi:MULTISPECIES: hypothetical protein [Agrobacterium tumefaciens complex]|uniref:hypothetical protein n=1 Tax=Agrobacterium tumefaciens complex TaxID=1183400 RepID=UPI0016061A02|nr:hypothetical protein [Agrobacterium radiobacter]MBB4407114.1 hypothetical protein [Agrobacterium radiobacter]MBB4452682.1 hypothetical protein [Agrobacterium radiobacter]UXR93897.1 hypothetical protein FY157_19675 [Agrobacterium tumefaciens]
MPKGLISELEKAALDVPNLTSHQVRTLLNRTINMVQRLHQEVPGEPINRDLMSYLRTASMETGKLSEDEKVHVLLDAAEGIRMLLSKRPTSLGEMRRTS